MAVNSRLDDGICLFVNFTAEFYPTTEVGGLAAEFPPPFHIVTVSSQSAKVPIEICWLFGGLLLGLGVKRAVRR